MKTGVTFVSLAVAAAAVQALPQLGYYKTRYSPDKTYGCMQVTSNTKQVTVMGKKVAYFEIVGIQGATPFACIPQMFIDTDDTPVDGDPVRFLFSSPGFAHCSGADGSGSLDVAFSASRIFWTGDSYGPIAIPGYAASAAGRVKERQTLSAEFYSTTACPP